MLILLIPGPVLHHPWVHIPGGSPRHQAGMSPDDGHAGAGPDPGGPLPPQPGRGCGHPRLLAPWGRRAADVCQDSHWSQGEQCIPLACFCLHIKRGNKLMMISVSN